MTKWIALGIVLLLLGAVAYIRTAADDPARWHADPGEITLRGTPNEYLVADHDALFLPLTPEEALQRFDAVATDDPRTTLIAGSIREGHATYVQRSAIFGYPDYISVRAMPAEEGSRLSIYSRSRYGHSDFGANKARVERWLTRLETP